MKWSVLRFGAMAAVACTGAALVVSSAFATSERRVRTGHYGWEQGPHTYDNAVYFQVQGSGTSRVIAKLQFRNDCLTHNQTNPPKIAINADGTFQHSWTSDAIDNPKISLSGSFVSPTKASGNLKIRDLSCRSTANFVAVPDPKARFAATSLSSPQHTERFDGSASSDPDYPYQIASWTWNFGDGTSTTKTTATVSHSYSSGGSETVKLTVKDLTTGYKNSKTKTVTVP
jgi:PKD repeat protein